MIKYEGKCAPASYRLGVVTSVVVDSDGLVRTVEVEYSLLSELPTAERLLYKGIAKKKLTVAVQRLVLILPVEERDLNSFCGGQADKAACVDGGDGDDVRAAAGHDAQVLAAEGQGGQVQAAAGRYDRVPAAADQGDTWDQCGEGHAGQVDEMKFFSWWSVAHCARSKSASVLDKKRWEEHQPRLL